MNRILLVSTLALLLPSGAAAQDDGRSLRWDSVHVQARLDSAGRLHVRERQVMVFDGAWNGGERAFDPRAGQRLRLEGIARVAPGTGELRPLTEDDDLDDVDAYDREGDRMRWRSRLEDDPPFDDTRLTYVLDYTLDNAVLPVDGSAGDYLLDYDFLFPDRAGPVGDFVLALALDPVWAPAEELPARWTARDIPPGRGFAVRIPLRFTGAGRPATVPVAVDGWLRFPLLLLLVGGAAAMALRFLARERAAGRFEPLPAVPGEDWLREHVLRYPPELVGAAWDGSTAAPEVAGLLARLVQEGKLASHVRPYDDAGDPVLHLELKAPRDAFDDTERPLIDALFFDGRTETDTLTVREHYEDTGFDPANTIAPALKERVADLPGSGARPAGTGAAAVALLAAVVLLVFAAVARPGDIGPAFLAFLFVALTSVPALVFAAGYARSVVRLRRLAIGFLVSAGIMVLGLALFIAGALETTDPGSGLSPYYRAGPFLLVAIAALGLAAVAFTLRVARTRELPERLALRRRLAAARTWFAGQLDSPDPDLRDEWFPWLLALGLGSHVDGWFQAYGPVQTASQTASQTALTAAAASAAGGRGGGWTGGGAAFGGGGGFAGGGVGASWGVAAATVASGVAAPSSGTAGGAASAGGGGGGGW